MDRETQERIKETVLEILKDANLDEMTVKMVWKTASEKLDMNLSEPAQKKFVRDVVDSFISEQVAKADQLEEEEEENVAAEEVVDEEVNSRKRCERESGVDGVLIICRLTKYRRVTVHEYKKKTFVSIREFFSKDGKEYPKAKGISMTCEQWASLKNNIPKIDKAIKEMRSK